MLRSFLPVCFGFAKDSSKNFQRGGFGSQKHQDLVLELPPILGVTLDKVTFASSDFSSWLVSRRVSLGIQIKIMSLGESSHIQGKS